MKLLKLTILALLCFSQCIKANGDNTIIDAIKESDPEALRYLLIPGFYIQNEEKKRYLSLAKAITNKTYVELHKNSWSDLTRSFKGALKFVAAAGMGLLVHQLYNTPETAPEEGQASEGTYLGMSKSRWAMYGFLSSLAGYFFYKGGEEFTSILSKQDRLEHHRSALAVEAIINRLPLCAEPACNMTHPEGAVK